jgi:energy-converting hydrogenase B subunit Q
MEQDRIGIVIEARDEPGVLHELTGVIARHRANIASVEILGSPVAGRSRIYFELARLAPGSRQPTPPVAGRSRIYFELEQVGQPQELLAELQAVDAVQSVAQEPSLQKIYGKRIIIMGGGAQVGQVAIGAISEADRHNIRGEHISVDTIPLVGEQALAAAVRAVARLPRAKALVLAGSLMGGEIEKAVREVRAQGLLVVSLNMAGSVPDAADLVVTDPVQAGVMTVMAIAETAKFTVERLKRRVF